MGTRNLTMVISEGKTKVAQYGQWDGYPEGQGATILSFLKRADLDEFRKQLKSINWLTDEQAKEIDEDKNWETNYPYISRDAAANILGAIHFGEIEVSAGIGARKLVKCTVKGLSDNSNFATDSLFCEWAYVIDLDNNKLEVYQGFNQTPLTENDRFFYLQDKIKDREDKYYPVKLVKEYSLGNLPEESIFIKECDPPEDEEENNDVPSDTFSQPQND